MLDVARDYLVLEHPVLECGLMRVDLSGITLIDPPIDQEEIAVIAIGSPGWALVAIDELLNDAAVVFVTTGGGFIDCVEPRELRSRTLPVWGQLRAILHERGVDVPPVRWS
jgi:hypothetical protein